MDKPSKKDNPSKSKDNPAKDAERKPGPLGEGNYEATRKYNEGLKDHVQHHDIEKEARDAAPNSPDEARDMKDAERKGAERSKGEDPALRSKAPKPSK